MAATDVSNVSLLLLVVGQSDCVQITPQLNRKICHEIPDLYEFTNWSGRGQANLWMKSSKDIFYGVNKLKYK